MSVTARADILVPEPLERTFADFIDFPVWRRWMPAACKPLWGPSRPLRTGDKVVVLVVGVLSVLHVEVVEGPREVVWSGGLPGLLKARHQFLFEDAGAQGTRILSIEPWTGLLTEISPVASRLLATAERLGRAQLVGFAQRPR